LKETAKPSPFYALWVASAVIAVATSAWGCSSRAESFDDWLDSGPLRIVSILTRKYFSYISFGRLCLFGGRSAVVRSGYTDLGWEHADLRWKRAGEASFPPTNNRVLEIPPMLDWDNTAAAILIPGDGD
jgi:hypothetical protein